VGRQRHGPLRRRSGGTDGEAGPERRNSRWALDRRRGSGALHVHFTDADILHVADTFWNGYYPFIDYSTGGSIDGMIRATEANLAKVTDSMIVIPGHGTVGDKSQLAFCWGFRCCRGGGANGVCRGAGAVATGKSADQSACVAGFHGEIQSDRRVAAEGATEFVNYGIDGAARSEP